MRHETTANAGRNSMASLLWWPHELQFIRTLGTDRLHDQGRRSVSRAHCTKRKGSRTFSAVNCGVVAKALFFWQVYRSERPQSMVAALILLELYYQTGNVDRLSHVVADLAAAKGARRWDEWLQEEITRANIYEAVVYTQNPEYLLSVISYSLRRESEKAAIVR